MKHNAPNRCEPSIEALNFRGEGVIRAEVDGEVKFLYFTFFFWGGEGGGVGGGGVGGGVMVDVNREVKFL